MKGVPQTDSQVANRKTRLNRERSGVLPFHFEWNRLLFLATLAVNLHRDSVLSKKGRAVTQRTNCEFFLLRYVPDVVKGEFINVGVILREISLSEMQVGDRTGHGKILVRFAVDRQCIKALDPDADLDLLYSLCAELTSKLSVDVDSETSGNQLLDSLGDILSNSIQITDPKACLAESVQQELDLLAKLYLKPASTEA